MHKNNFRIGIQLNTHRLIYYRWYAVFHLTVSIANLGKRTSTHILFSLFLTLLCYMYIYMYYYFTDDVHALHKTHFRLGFTLLQEGVVYTKTSRHYYEWVVLLRHHVTTTNGTCFTTYRHHVTTRHMGCFTTYDITSLLWMGCVTTISRHYVPTTNGLFTTMCCYITSRYYNEVLFYYNITFLLRIICLLSTCFTTVTCTLHFYYNYHFLCDVLIITVYLALVQRSESLSALTRV